MIFNISHNSSLINVSHNGFSGYLVQGVTQNKEKNLKNLDFFYLKIMSCVLTWNNI